MREPIERMRKLVNDNLVMNLRFQMNGELNKLESEIEQELNSRAERTCFADEVTHRDCKYSINRGWRERTCECIVEYAKSPLDGKTIVLHRCSSCNELMRPHMNYCPNCGARVVE